MIFSSHRITHKKRLIPEAKDLMGEYAKEIRSEYYEIFNENSKSQRVAFFSDNIVQFLWSKFSQREGDRISPMSESDPIKRQVLFKEIQEMEDITNFEILPVQHSNMLWSNKILIIEIYDVTS